MARGLMAVGGGEEVGMVASSSGALFLLCVIVISLSIMSMVIFACGESFSPRRYQGGGGCGGGGGACGGGGGGCGGGGGGGACGGGGGCGGPGGGGGGGAGCGGGGRGGGGGGVW